MATTEESNFVDEEDEDQDLRAQVSPIPHDNRNHNNGDTEDAPDPPLAEWDSDRLAIKAQQKALHIKYGIPPIDDDEKRDIGKNPMKKRAKSWYKTKKRSSIDKYAEINGVGKDQVEWAVPVMIRRRLILEADDQLMVVYNAQAEYEWSSMATRYTAAAPTLMHV